MRSSAWKWCAAFLAAAFSWSVPTGVAVAAEAGVTESEIKLGMWTPLTGPIALIGTSERDGVSVWVREVNDAGGIHGRKIALTVYDDGGSPQEAQAAVRRLLGQDRVFALIAGSASGSTLPVLPLIRNGKVPFVSSISSHRKLMEPFSRYVFRIYAMEIPQAYAVADWIVEKNGLKRVAIIYNSNDYGVGGYETAAERLEKKHRLKFAAAERYNPGDQDFSAQLLRIKQANPEAVLVYAFAPEAGIIVRQARELGLQARFFGGGATSTPLFLRGAGQLGVGFEATYVMPDLGETTKHQGIIAYREKLRRWFHPSGFPPGRPSEYDLAAYGAGKVTGEALQRAGRELTREKFVDALESLKNFDTGVTFPVSYSATSHEGTTRVNLVRVNQKVEWEILGEYELKD